MPDNSEGFVTIKQDESKQFYFINMNKKNNFENSRGGFEENMALSKENELKILGQNPFFNGAGLDNGLWDYNSMDAKENSYLSSLKNPGPGQYETNSSFPSEEPERRDPKKLQMDPKRLELMKLAGRNKALRQQSQQYRQDIEMTAQQKAQEWYNEFMKKNFPTPKARKRLTSPKMTDTNSKVVEPEPEPNNRPPSKAKLNQKPEKNLKTLKPAGDFAPASPSVNEMICFVEPKNLLFSDTVLGAASSLSEEPEAKEIFFRNSPKTEKSSHSITADDGEDNSLDSQDKSYKSSGSCVSQPSQPSSSEDSGNSLCLEADCNQVSEVKQNDEEKKRQQLKLVLPTPKPKTKEPSKQSRPANNEEMGTDSESYYLSKSFSTYSVDSGTTVREKINIPIDQAPKLVPPKKQQQNFFSKSPRLRYNDPRASDSILKRSSDSSKKKVSFNSNPLQHPLPKIRVTSKVRLTNPNLKLSEKVSKDEVRKKSSVLKTNGKICIKDMHRKDDISYIDDSYDTFYYKYYKPEMRRTIIVCKYRGLIKNKGKKSPAATTNPTSSTPAPGAEEEPQSQEPETNETDPTNPNISPESLKKSPSVQKLNLLKETQIPVVTEKVAPPKETPKVAEKKPKSIKTILEKLRQKNFSAQAKTEDDNIEDVKSGVTLTPTKFGVNFAAYRPLEFPQPQTPPISEKNPPKSQTNLQRPGTLTKSSTSLNSTKSKSKKLSKRKSTTTTSAPKKKSKKSTKSSTKKSDKKKDSKSKSKDSSSSKRKDKDKDKKSNKSKSKKSSSNSTTKTSAKSKKKSTKSKAKSSSKSQKAH